MFNQTTEVSSLIQAYLTNNNITQKEFADKLGVSSSMVNHLINNRCTLSPKISMKLDRLFEIDERERLTSGQIIKKSMKLKGVGVGFVSQYARLSIHHLYSIMEDRKALTVSMAVRIANALKNVTANELLHAQINRLVRAEYERENVLAKPINFSKFDTRKAS